MLTTKKYVGTAKIFPDSRIPRRLPTVRDREKPQAGLCDTIGIEWGTAEVIARTPAEMLTATVSV